MNDKANHNLSKLNHSLYIKFPQTWLSRHIFEKKCCTNCLSSNMKKVRRQKKANFSYAYLVIKDKQKTLLDGSTRLKTCEYKNFWLLTKKLYVFICTHLISRKTTSQDTFQRRAPVEVLWPAIWWRFADKRKLNIFCAYLVIKITEKYCWTVVLAWKLVSINSLGRERKHQSQSIRHLYVFICISKKTASQDTFPRRPPQIL